MGSKKRNQKGYFEPMFDSLTTGLRPENYSKNYASSYMTTCIRYAHVKFGVDSTDFVLLIAHGDLAGFFCKKRFVTSSIDVITFRTSHFSSRNLLSCSQAQLNRVLSTSKK